MMMVAVTAKGLNFYINQSISKIVEEAINFHIDLDVVFKVSSYQFRFHEFRLTEAFVESMTEQLNDVSPKLCVFAKGILAKLNFEFTIR